jgi:hypothetical protein
MREANFPWPTIDANEQRQTFEENCEASWTTDFILLDAEGGVLVRHFRFDQIRPHIERLMAETASGLGEPPADGLAHDLVKFDLFWPPHDPTQPDRRPRHPLLHGVLENRVVLTPDGNPVAKIRLTLTRPHDEMSREF